MKRIIVWGGSIAVVVLVCCWGQVAQAQQSGDVWSWGWNDHGILGYATASDQNPTPKHVGGCPGNIVAVSLGTRHSLALDSDGTVWSWGGNAKGQLGRDTSWQNSANPQQVAGPGGTGILGEVGGNEVASISAGSEFSVAVMANGDVYAWGDNEYGQLGNGESGSGEKSPYPVQVKIDSTTDLEDVLAVAAGPEHCLALGGASSVYAWGQNSHDQLGYGTNSLESYAGEVDLPAGISVKSIAATNTASFVLENDSGNPPPPEVRTYPNGEVWSWGDSTLGRSETPSTPAEVKQGLYDLDHVSQIAAGSGHVIAVRSGELWGWGYGDYGQLGEYGGSSRAIDLEIEHTDVDKAFAGGWNTYYVRDNGELYGLGLNDGGQLQGTPDYGQFFDEPVRLNEDVCGTVHALAGGDWVLVVTAHFAPELAITAVTNPGWVYQNTPVTDCTAVCTVTLTAESVPGEGYDVALADDGPGGVNVSVDPASVVLDGTTLTFDIVGGDSETTSAGIEGAAYTVTVTVTGQTSGLEASANVLLVQRIPGDANGDGQVTGADFSIWKSQNGQVGAGWSGDFNGDGQVTGADFSIWKLNNGQVAP